MTPKPTAEGPTAVAEPASPAERAARLARVARQSAVRAVAIHAQDVGEPDPSAGNPPYDDVDVVIAIEMVKPPGDPTVRYDVTFEVETPPSAKRAGMRVEIVLRMVVTLPPETQADVETLSAYAERYVIEALFPYFRETFHSLAARMGRAATLGNLGPPDRE